MIAEIEALPPWAQGLAIGSFAVSLGAFAAYRIFRSPISSKRGRDAGDAGFESAAALVAYQPRADQATRDTIVHILGEVQSDVKAIRSILEEEQKDRERDMRDELRDFRRMASEWKRPMALRDRPEE